MNGKSILTALIKIATADKNLHILEESYLKQAAIKLEVSEAEIIEIRQNMDDIPFVPPADEQDRMTIFYYLLFLIKADNLITVNEVQLVKEYGFKLGFDEYMTDDLVQVIINHVDKKLPPEVMLETVKKYLN